MKREREFRAYLQKNTPNSEDKYVSYCNQIESAFKKEIDEIIVNAQAISRIEEALSKVISKGSVSSYISGFNAYLDFAFNSTTPPIFGSVSTSTSLYHVARAKGVKLTPDVAFAAQVLEAEYAGVLRFAQKLFDKDDFDYIPVIISEERPMDEWPRESPEAVRNVTGRFFPDPKPHIEIYYRNIKSGDAATYRNCLAHEYLHYLHYAYAGAEYSNASKALKEALADFFAILYSIHRHEKSDVAVAKARYDQWKKMFGTHWPYAQALHFYRVGCKTMKFSPDYEQYVKHGSIGKFIQTFLSTQHPDDAFMH